MDDDAFWLRVHAFLDLGDDPLADPEVVAALEDRPELLQEYARVVEALRALRHARLRPGREAGRPLRRAAWSGLAAAAALAWCLWPRHEPVLSLPAGDPLRVLHLRVVHTSPAGANAYEQSAAGARCLRVAQAPLARVLRCVIETTSHSGEVSR